MVHVFFPLRSVIEFFVYIVYGGRISLIHKLLPVNNSVNNNGNKAIYCLSYYQ